MQPHPSYGAPKPRKLGLFDGIAAMFRGAWFIVSTPSVWGLSLVPTLLALVLMVGCGILGVWGAVFLADLIVGAATGWMLVALWALRIGLGALALFVAIPVALSLAQPLSAFALDRIGREQEKKLGLPAWPEQGVGASMWLSLKVTFTALLIGLPVLAALTLVTMFFPPASIVTLPLKFLVGALMVAWDFLDYPLSARGASIGGRLRFFKDHFWAALGFGVAGALLLLIPFVGLLILPIGVAAGARLVVEQEKLMPRIGAARPYA
ncbi:MAG: EI24 domain-containing protein [Polyangiaceae bacterium]